MKDSAGMEQSTKSKKSNHSKLTLYAFMRKDIDLDAEKEKDD